ncbi:MAG: hypothetical protein GY884_28445 [Proteobacteria bacterium]|nr:hypothetical protein [Pseudomonadota bacterium]
MAGVEVTEGAFRMLGRLPGLESLEVLSCRENDLSPVANLTRLKHLSIDSYASSSLALSGLDALESLRLQGFHSQLVEGLRELSMRKVELLHCGQLTGWEALEDVEELLLTGYRWRKANELDGLGWDGLKTIRVFGKRLPATHVNRLAKAGVTLEVVSG